MTWPAVRLAVQPRRYSLRIGGNLFDPELFNAVGAERPGFVKPSALRIADLTARRLGISVDLIRHLPDGDRDEETFRPRDAQVLLKGVWARPSPSPSDTSAAA
jgi:hypothetical protein